MERSFFHIKERNIFIKNVNFYILLLELYVTAALWFALSNVTFIAGFFPKKNSIISDTNMRVWSSK